MNAEGDGAQRWTAPASLGEDVVATANEALTWSLPQSARHSGIAPVGIGNRSRGVRLGPLHP